MPAQELQLTNSYTVTGNTYGYVALEVIDDLQLKLDVCCVRKIRQGFVHDGDHFDIHGNWIDICSCYRNAHPTKRLIALSDLPGTDRIWLLKKNLRYGFDRAVVKTHSEKRTYGLFKSFTNDEKDRLHVINNLNISWDDLYTILKMVRRKSTKGLTPEQLKCYVADQLQIGEATRSDLPCWLRHLY